MLTLVENVSALMAERGDTQLSVAERGGISQRAVGYVLTFGKSHETSPTLRTIEGLGKAFSVHPWLLLVPGLDATLLQSPALPSLIANYAASADLGRDTISRIAETEARYGSGGKPMFSKALR